jgi:hypothetical protein
VEIGQNQRRIEPTDKVTGSPTKKETVGCQDVGNNKKQSLKI